MAVPDLTLFISHSSADRQLAKGLIDLFEKATKLAARQIRCTSVPGHRLPVGADTDEQLRREIFVAQAFIGIITPSSATSTYVLFELGARWGAKKHLAPVLARGSNIASLGGPLAGLNALSLTDRGQVLQLVEDVADYLQLPLEPMTSFQDAVDAVVVLALFPSTDITEKHDAPSLELSSDETKILELLAASDRRVSTDIAQHLGVQEQKARYYLDKLYDKGLVGWEIHMNRPTKYYLKQSGRAALVDRGLL